MKKKKQKKAEDAINDLPRVEKSTNDEKEVALYDFKHPNLISKSQLRLLENIHEGLARNLGVYLSAQMRMVVDLKLSKVEQIQYSEFMTSMKTPDAIYVGQVEEPSSKIVLEVNPQLVVFIVERLFGGSGEFLDDARQISVIEQRVMKRVIDHIGEEISTNWKPVKDVKCAIDRFESNPEFVQIVPSSEPVVAVSIDVNIQGHSSDIVLCYPYMWIQGILSSPGIYDNVILGGSDQSDDEKDIIDFNLRKTTIDLQAVLGTSKVSIRDIIGMEKDDVIVLNTDINSEVPIFMRNRKLYTASIGQTNKKYSCRINSVIKGAYDE